MKLSGLRQWSPGSDGKLVGGYWAVVVPVLLLQYVADTGWMWWRVLPVVAVTVLLDTAMVAVLVERFLPLFLSRKWWRGLVQLPVLLLLSGGLYLVLYGCLLGHRIDLSGGRLVLGVVAHAKSYGLLAVLLTGKRYVGLQQMLLRTRQAQTESELRNLKAQLDPHFLFNNLNVLRGLIQHDPAEAHEFLNRFAALYRFLIRYKDEDVVPLSEELQFAQEYIYLLRHRFGAAYEFREEIAASANLGQLLVVPGTLQLLVENAIKHNAGDEENPLVITIVVAPVALTVSHPHRPKLTAVESMGTGLANLRERYRLLFGRSIEVAQSPILFTVTVPVVPLGKTGPLAQRTHA
ncbi:sensor histidine kinase [Hymenobacter canadensis]|uniref:Sensor histidine kinase n=1 Tax=Hymenobacter canadensis TaxID=2999067 RepID=A0ABY7LJE3_9BACT|nr:sensor histidine kinase [Hymenobacter canadensis]WBA40549.1 sensor histidine kinase [Hymenobacter canadensis]